MTDSRDSPLSEEEKERLEKALAEQRERLGSVPLSKKEREAQNLEKAVAILEDAGFYKAIDGFFRVTAWKGWRTEVAKLIRSDDRLQHFETTGDGWKCKINDKVFELRGTESAYSLRYQSEVVFEQRVLDQHFRNQRNQVRIALLKKEWLDVIPRIHEVFQDAIDSYTITLKAVAAERKRENSPKIDLGDFE